MSKAYKNAEETCIRLKELELIAKGNGDKNLGSMYELLYTGAIIATRSIKEGPLSYMDLKLVEDLGTGYLEQLNKRGFDA